MVDGPAPRHLLSLWRGFLVQQLGMFQKGTEWDWAGVSTDDRFSFDVGHYLCRLIQIDSDWLSLVEIG